MRMSNSNEHNYNLLLGHVQYQFMHVACISLWFSSLHVYSNVLFVGCY